MSILKKSYIYTSENLNNINEGSFLNTSTYIETIKLTSLSPEREDSLETEKNAVPFLSNITTRNRVEKKRKRTFSPDHKDIKHGLISILNQVPRKHDMLSKSNFLETPILRKDSRLRIGDSTGVYTKPILNLYSYKTKPTVADMRELYDVSLYLGKSDIDLDFPYSETHQGQLNLSGCNLLSLEDVIVPAVINSHERRLKFLQAKAQGQKDDETVRTLKMCRSALLFCGNKVMRSVKCTRLRRKMMESDKDENETGLVDIKTSKMRKAYFREMDFLHPIKEKDRWINERKKNFPKNRDLWREIALLMTDLTRLEKERKLWYDLMSILDEKERMLKDIPGSNNNLHILTNIESDPKEDIINVRNIQKIVDDIVLPTNRINDSLHNLLNLIGDSDTIRSILYEKYKKDHKFHGYVGMSNLKILIRSLGLG